MLIPRIFSILVSFGGIAGLFLGFSLLSGVEFIYYFTIRSCCMVNMQKNELENIQKELKKQLTAYDMSLVPTFISDKHNNNHNYSNNLQRFSNVSNIVEQVNNLDYIYPEICVCLMLNPIHFSAFCLLRSPF